MATPRLLAPDFARGGMLLLILLSNTAFFLYAGDYTRSDSYPEPTSAADSVTQFLMLALLDVRIYPLFAFLVGYGIVQTLTRRMASGATQDEAAATIRSRNRWLFVFGFVHAALLLGTEVLAAYGLIGLVLCALFLRGSERRLRTGILIGVGVLALVFVAAAAALALITFLNPAGEAAPLTDESARFLISGAAEGSYLVSVLFRLSTWFVLLFVNGFGFVLPTAILIGMWAARHRVLEEPERHRALIRRVAALGTALGLAGALPGALKHVGAFDPAPYYGLSDVAMGATAWTSGLAGGLGYVALFALVSGFLTRRGRPPVVVTSVAALGKRSLSGYLVHSIVLVPVLSAWGLGLGAHLTSFTMALFALGLWLLTVVVAALMERGGRRGPFEILLRRLSDRQRPRQLSGL